MTATHETVDRAALLDRLASAERELHALAIRAVEPWTMPADLTLRQLQVLTLVRHTPGITGQDLAHLLGVSTPTTSGIVERVAAKRWVRREHDPSDRRRLLLHLTAAGEQLLEDLEEPTRLGRQLVLDRLGDAEVADLVRLVERMRDVALDVGAERG
ncbi:Transcriptional regulator, MarR family [Serinicoccus hydrothermalis]|uniref:Transcriptional regulator, MarR family n=1 Tax=Serinicoccus hydrothermalis TaxID=1758689 RepID=A0A1B1NE06_9MICO|nr:MarR family transcriptional regulator [Serinicoccus hydrothermalis]ANS79678.1 Transcriptional regulator, MarR family [Serinicoccus hydrothermalis]